MKNKASAFLKQVICMLSSITKAKSMAIKNKTSVAKARLIMFSLMKSKKVLIGSISNKIHGLLGHHDHKEIGKENEDGGDDQSKAIVVFNAAMATEATCMQMQLLDNDEDEDNKYPDLKHCLFDEEDLELDDQGGSIIDLVRNSKEEGEEFSLEEEIDHVADLFIKRFHKQMRLQKLESFKRFQEMLARGV